jgi:hypothetical protein
MPQNCLRTAAMGVGDYQPCLFQAPGLQILEYRGPDSLQLLVHRLYGQNFAFLLQIDPVDDQNGLGKSPSRRLESSRTGHPPKGWGTRQPKAGFKRLQPGRYALC